MNKVIEDFIQSKRIAIMGASRDPRKFGNAIVTELKQKGYEVFIIHPEAKEISGQTCYPSLAALKGQVDAVVICVAPDKASQALQQVADAGLTKIWVNQGSQSPEVIAKAKELGLSPVMGKCLLMYAAPVESLHKWHRAFAKIFGQY